MLEVPSKSFISSKYDRFSLDGAWSIMEKGHFISSTPLPQHKHEIRPSGEAPMYGKSFNSTSPVSSKLRFLCFLLTS